MKAAPSRHTAKDQVRREMRTRPAGLTPLLRAQEEELVNAAIIADEDFRHADVIAVYKAVGPELSIVSATNAAFRAGKTVAFPRVASGALVLHEVSGWDELSPGAYGIPEPAETSPVVSPATVDLVIVPGVAFTLDGRRLGQGGGFYDRLLPQVGGISWGVCFDAQLADTVPTEAHDRPVDRVIAPRLLA